MGVFNGLYRLGSLAGMLAGGFIADLFGLTTTALFFGAVTFSAIPFAFLHVPDAKNKTADSTEKSASLLVLWQDSTIFWALTTGAIVAMIYQGIFTSTLSYLLQIHNSSYIDILGFSIGAASLAGILQAIRWSWEPWLAPWVGIKSDGRHGRKKVLLLSLLLATGLFCLLPLDIPLFPWLLLVMGVQLTATALTTLTDAVAADAATRSSKIMVLTAYSLAIDLGSAIGPFIGYVLNTTVNPYASYWMAAASLLLVSFAWFLPGRGNRV
jgi:MFS family permease